MKLIFLDFETYYDDQYSLRKMTPAEYILDPRFETICVSVAVDDGPVEWIDGPDFGAWLSQFKPDECVIVTYNALFDMCILYWHYGFLPVRMIDALGMARTLLGHLLRSLSLAKVAEHLGLPKKGGTLGKVKGLHRAEIMGDPYLWSAFKDYNKHDTWLLREIFLKLAPDFPQTEYAVMDLVLRCAVAPRFRVDVPMLEQHLADTCQKKEALLHSATWLHGNGDKAVAKGDLMSNVIFKQLLEDQGVVIQYKNGANGPIPAFAKTDDFMAELSENENPTVQALAAARLGVKSTLEETRAERLLAIAALNWEKLLDGNMRLYSGGTMPIPLRYSGAHTLRLSGDWRMNMQNLPRGGALRKALIPPPGHKVVVGDLGQIEARLTAWLAAQVIGGEPVLLKAFREGKDPYGLLATSIFGFEVHRKKPEHFVQGFIGKSGVLGLGFGAAAQKFYAMVIRTARSMGLDINELKKIWTLELAEASVKTYRTVNHETPKLWYKLDWALEGPWLGVSPAMRLGPVVIGKGTVIGPGGLTMRYADPRHTPDGPMFDYGGRPSSLYGARFLENIIQFLARLIVMHAALRLSPRLQFVHQCHDELVFIVPHNEVDLTKKIVHAELIRRPSWAPDLPLTADVGVGDSYGEAK